MAITDIDWGTVTLTNGSTTVTGSGTSWIADDIRDGDTFVFVDGGDGFQQPIVASVQSNTELTLRNEWEGPTLTATAYTLRYQWDSSRVSAMSRRLIMLLESGNVEALAGLTGPGVAVFNGPHSMEVRPFSDFVNGVRFDVQVDALADRDAYDGQTQGFTVLVSDMGDGRSAIFTKNSNTSGDWSDAAYITGPVGPTPEVEATVSMLPPGSTATVTEVPITGGVRLDFALPEASGFNNEGVYDIAVAYVRDDVVRHMGSSFIALQAVPAGTSPSSAFPPVDTAYWQVLAARGQDGTGTGDMIGPPSSTANGFVGFYDTGGKQTKQLTSAEATAGLDTFEEATSGLVPGPTSGDISANRLLQADGTWVDPPSGGDPDIEFVVAQLAIAAADSNNIAQFLGTTGNRVADSFDTLTYVDVAGATNLNTSVTGVLKPTTTAGTQQIPTMTGATTSGVTMSASTVYTGGYEAWKAGDKNTATFWSSASPQASPHWLKIDFGSEKSIGTYTLQARSDSNRDTDIVAFNLEGSNDDSSWTTLDSRSSLTWASSEIKTFTPSTTGSFRYYRIYITQTPTTTSGAVIVETTMTTLAVANNLTVSSTAFTAAAAPTRMKSLVQVKEVDASTAGTDYSIECSRDGGVTWSTMSLTEKYTLPNGLRVVDVAETDISGQPNGTSPKWRFKTLNNKNVELHDIYLYWR